MQQSCSGLLTADATVTMRGGAGDDLMSANNSAHSLQYGDEGNDSINGANGDAAIANATGSDTLYGGLGNDRFEAYGGADSLSGDEGLDTLDGGMGNDTLFGGVEEDRIIGSAGNDILYGDTLPLSAIPFADVFVETGNDGFDIIRDFQFGYDQLSLGFGYTLQAETYSSGVNGVMIYETATTPAATTFVEGISVADLQVSIL